MNKIIFIALICTSLTSGCSNSCECFEGSNVCKSCKLDYLGSQMDSFQRSCSCPLGWYSAPYVDCEYTYAEGQYSPGCFNDCKDYATLDEAKQACNVDPDCQGITYSFKSVGGSKSTDSIGNGHGYQLRHSNYGTTFSPNKENTWLKGKCSDPQPANNPSDFEAKQGTYLGGCVQNCKDFQKLTEAQDACRQDSNCGGVTFSRREIGGNASTNAFDGVWGYQLRAGRTFNQSPNGENSWLKVPSLSCGYIYANGQYSGGCAQNCRDFASLDEAKAACNADASCKGITYSFAAVGGSSATNSIGNGHGYQLRASSTGSVFSPNKENTWIKQDCPAKMYENNPCDFQASQGTYLGGCAQNCRDFSSLTEALQACRQDSNCGGVTFSRREIGGSASTNPYDGVWGFQLRYGTGFVNSPNGENSWLKVKCPIKPFVCSKLVNPDNDDSDNGVIMDACKIDIGLKTKNIKVETDCHFEVEDTKSFVVSAVTLDVAQCNFNLGCLDSIVTMVQYENLQSKTYVNLPEQYLTQYPQGKNVIKIPLIAIFDLAYEQTQTDSQISQIVHLQIFIGHSDKFVRIHKWNMIVYTNKNQVEVFSIDIDIQRTEGCQPGQDCIIIADLDTIGQVYIDNTYSSVKNQLQYQVGDTFYTQIKFTDPTYTKKLDFVGLYFKNDENKVFNFSGITSYSWDGDGLRIELPLVELTISAVIQIKMLISTADTKLRRIQQTTDTSYTVSKQFKASIFSVTKSLNKSGYKEENLTTANKSNLLAFISLNIITLIFML